jgi:hypothetical protein
MDARAELRYHLEALAVKARAAVPDLNGRLERALKLVLTGDVHLLADGTARVSSATEPLTTYKVAAACTCHDYPRAPRGLCQHKLAAIFTARLHHLLPPVPDAGEPWPEPETPSAEPSDAPDRTTTLPAASLPAQATPVHHEAPCSMNVHVTLGGRDVLVTLRGVDEGEVLTRLERLLERFPAGGSAGAPAAVPVCQWHGAMKESTKAPGTYFCPAKRADGSYCTSRQPAPGGTQ